MISWNLPLILSLYNSLTNESITEVEMASGGAGMVFNDNKKSFDDEVAPALFKYAIFSDNITDCKFVFPCGLLVKYMMGIGGVTSCQPIYYFPAWWEKVK